jgi:hypothetical protein
LTKRSASLAWTTRKLHVATATYTCRPESKRSSWSGELGAVTAGRKPLYSHRSGTRRCVTTTT